MQCDIFGYNVSIFTGHIECGFPCGDWKNGATLSRYTMNYTMRIKKRKFLPRNQLGEKDGLAKGNDIENLNEPALDVKFVSMFINVGH